jgi:hypothetical protein
MIDFPNTTCIQELRVKPEFISRFHSPVAYRNGISSSSTIFINVTVTSNYSDYTKHLIATVEKFRTLEKGFDSYNADKISIGSIEQAIAFIKLADKNNLPLYFASPGINGDVLVELNNKNGKVAEVYFNSDGTTEQLHYLNGKCVNESDHEIQLLNTFFA